MPVWTRDTDAPDTGLSARSAQSADLRPPVRVRAMAGASRLFSAAADADALPDLAARALAIEPGQMCVVSLADRSGANLRPVAVAHIRLNVERNLRHAVLDAHRPSADAFSHAVLRSGSALRMVIDSPSMLRLWLPDVYWPYVERAAVSGVLAAALRDRERVFGALLLWREGNQPPFDELDQAYVVSLAQRLGLGLATHALVASTPTATQGSPRWRALPSGD
jgi:GAF domain-containing protein